jgi:hypothetical protein
MLITLQQEVPEPMHAQRLCVRYMRPCAILEFGIEKERLIAQRQRFAAVKAAIEELEQRVHFHKHEGVV